MKLSQLFAAVLVLGAILFAGCKGDEPKDLIVKKWQFTEVSGPDAAQIPDSVKTKMYATATMEFKKDGTYEQAGGMREGIQKGTYSLSDDGKMIISKEDGRSIGDTVMVLELTKTKMVVAPKSKNEGQNMQLTMIPK